MQLTDDCPSGVGYSIPDRLSTIHFTSHHEERKNSKPTQSVPVYLSISPPADDKPTTQRMEETGK